MKRLTIEEIMEVHEITCAKCGGSATVYPYLVGKGTCFCPNCSPMWLASFLQYATENVRREPYKHGFKKMRSSHA